MRNDKDNIIVKKTFEFAPETVKFSKLLEQNKKCIVPRSFAESKADFIHKIKIAAKEADET